MHIPPAICVATHHASIAEMLNDAEFLSLANRDGFLIELRLDFFDDLGEMSLHHALDVFAPNVVVTYRHPLEGGKRTHATGEERLRYLQQAADRGVKYIDIEARTPRDGFNKRGAKLILSHHDFDKTPREEDFHAVWSSMHAQTDVDVVKIAVTPKVPEDSIAVHRLLSITSRPEHSHRPTLILSMGEVGFWTRILAGRFGAPFTFARGEGARGNVLGQPTWRELEDLYRFRNITPAWKIYGVFGNPIAHSLSPLMHNTAFAELGLPCVYIPFKVEEFTAALMREFRFLIRGASVTIPHKETVLPFCDDIDASARKIGAVNTLKEVESNSAIEHFLPPQLAGSNTDAPAAADCLETALGSLIDKHILVIGAGGAARAIIVGVMERGARVSVLNRTRQRADKLAQEMNARAISFDEIANLQFDAIVNATPLGMFPEIATTPLEENQIPQGGLVFDTVYNPLRTRLLEMAVTRGCKTIQGVEMFINQGVRQFELWTGEKAPRAAMERVVLEALRKRQR